MITIMFVKDHSGETTEDRLEGNKADINAAWAFGWFWQWSSSEVMALWQLGMESDLFRRWWVWIIGWIWIGREETLSVRWHCREMHRLHDFFKRQTDTFFTFHEFWTCASRYLKLWNKIFPLLKKPIDFAVKYFFLLINCNTEGVYELCRCRGLFLVLFWLPKISHPRESKLESKSSITGLMTHWGPCKVNIYLFQRYAMLWFSLFSTSPGSWVEANETKMAMKETCHQVLLKAPRASEEKAQLSLIYSSSITWTYTLKFSYLFISTRASACGPFWSFCFRAFSVLSIPLSFEPLYSPSPRRQECPRSWK